jgi:hypothetical protein
LWIRNTQPFILLSSRFFFSLKASIKGAPNNSKGIVVPLASDRLRASISTVPGYTIALFSVGMLGEGRTHGSPVSLKSEDLCQFFIHCT